KDQGVNDVFTMRQVEEFKKIYAFKPIQASLKKESKFLARLEKQDNNAYLRQLKEKQCYQKHWMIDASARFGILNSGVSKAYLTTNYNFKSLHAHYQQHGLAPKIYKLSGCVSNSAISFDTVLHVL
ncbi:27189_t:CDS:2, partial [Gigaspora margarita]